MTTVVESIGDKPALFLDLSSKCTGWCISQVIDNEVNIFKCGSFWYDDTENHGVKYNKTANFIKELCRTWNIKSVISEAYFTRAGFGCQVCVELHGVIKSALQDLEDIPTYEEICVQSWRSGGLKVKKDPTKTGSAAWKPNTKKRVEEILNFKFPDYIISNVTNKKRKLSYDLVDAVGICLGYLSLEPNNFKKFILNKDAI